MGAKTDAAIQCVEKYGVAGLDPDGGLLFEPRALWSVGRFNTDDAPAPNRDLGEIVLSKQELTNGARWPVVITRISLAAINYLLANNEPTTPVSPPTDSTFRNAASVLATAQFLLGVPRRQYYSRAPISSLALAARPTAMPTMRGTSTDYASSPWGLSRLEFDKPLRMPSQGGIEVALGSPTSYSRESQLDSFSAAIHVEELGGGLFPGNSRDKALTLATQAGTAPADGGIVVEWSKFNQVFPPAQTFTHTEFTKQRPSRSGSSAFSAISVLIDQLASDTVMQTSGEDGIVGSPICPLSLRTPVRIRTVGGASGTDWWRAGAPLGLVFTDVSPSLVYDLPMPITLNPGDALSVMLRLPQAVTLPNGEGPPIVISPVYQIGFAANGFAVIEG